MKVVIRCNIPVTNGTILKKINSAKDKMCKISIADIGLYYIWKLREWMLRVIKNKADTQFVVSIISIIVCFLINAIYLKLHFLFGI